MVGVGIELLVLVQVMLHVLLLGAEHVDAVAFLGILDFHLII